VGAARPTLQGEWVGPVEVATCHDYHLVMKRVGIADLKAHLSEHLRTVRRGGDLQSVKTPPPLHDEADSLGALLEERAERW
jgi:hypothetical protein